MKNLILCGGVGSRLWPLSRTLMPKQFYPLINGKSLFEDTVLRNKSVCTDVLLATNKDQYMLASDQLLAHDLSDSGGVIEPCGRNTAPAIALVCMGLDFDDVLLVSPSDHLISNKKEYEKVLLRAEELASNNNLVTFGIKPTFPETGFGYIEASNEDVVSFKEKPILSIAEEYVAKGNYYWNSGIFCFKAGVFLEELKKYSPNVYDTCLAVYNSCNGSLIEPSYELMMNIPSISIDYAVMEKSDRVKVIPSDIGWSDLGSFDSLYDEMYNPSKENAILGAEDPIIINSTHNLVMSDKRKVAIVDVSDLIIIDSEDALLVTKRGSSQKVKEVVANLQKDNSSLLHTPVRVIRPWGNYSVLQDEPTYKVKRLEVKPGKKLSLQYHQKRQEHWTVVEGLARVILDDEILNLSRNEAVYIPTGSKHRLENIGQVPLIIIETQIGTYFGED
ncbi:MAG: mannose-1-phosphate guanylyltransferase/mannose-6-phosphate isomerase [Spirochaetaceae bacterium]